MHQGHGKASDTCRVQPGSGRRDVEEIARVAALWRLAVGAAHTLNNSLTAIVAEASFLREQRKGDPELVEGCEAIMVEVERCARLTRALLARRHPPQDGEPEVDLGRLVGDLGPLLAQTLGRRIELTVRLPDDLVVIAGDAWALELLVVSLAQLVADLQPGASKLRMTVAPGPEPGRTSLELLLEAKDLAPDRAEGALDPDRGDGLHRLAIQASRTIAEAHGATLSSRPTGQGLAVCVCFPVLE